MLRQLKHNEKGIVFITVLVLIIVMMVITISIISVNISQVLITESEVRRLQADILLMGALAYTFANQLTDTPSNDITYIQNLNGINFNIQAMIDGTSSGIFDTNEMNIVVSYP